jgi:hypothetical protein
LPKFLRKGYPIARRTIAKYREQLDIPVARMRKRCNLEFKNTKKGNLLKYKFPAPNL